MKTMALLGILSLVYAALVLYITVKKPQKIWNMKKIQMFRKALGEKGTVIFFYIWSVAFIALGIWLFTLE